MINRPMGQGAADLLVRLLALSRGLGARLNALEKALNPTLAPAGPPHVYVQAADPVGTYPVVDGDLWIVASAGGGVKVRVTGSWVTSAS